MGFLANRICGFECRWMVLAVWALRVRDAPDVPVFGSRQFE